MRDGEKKKGIGIDSESRGESREGSSETMRDGMEWNAGLVLSVFLSLLPFCGFRLYLSRVTMIDLLSQYRPSDLYLHNSPSTPSFDSSSCTALEALLRDLTVDSREEE